ncbi:YhcN/YlaJ family sporulation lipoprotein [Virgibacillus sp. SK37]|uniref:YhcN/YlaJ family sporulation lipoprotein n=1 Tax=Virgibacillus sp. SK37 TaxID=403957 RepID=UPI0035107AA7
MSITSILALALVACGTNDNGDNQEGAMGDNNNIEQTRYNNTGDGMAGDRDHNMMRNSERDQNRTDTRNGNENRYDVAEEAANKITDKVDEIENAYVLTTDNNAYVAARLDTNDNNGNNNNNNNGNNNNKGNEVTDKVKDEITKIVKSVDKDIDNVYVSTNPDFVDLTNNYINDVDNGEPIEGFFDQFGNMVDRLFPDNE